METFRQNIQEALKKKRPNLTESSLKTYVSILANISKKLDPKNEDIDIFDKHEEILDLLKEKPAHSRKTPLSALFVLTGNEFFNKQMLEDCKTTNSLYREQQKTQKQEENWIDVKEIQEIYDGLFKNVNLMFSKKLAINSHVIVNFFLLGFLGGVSGIPPRRSMDYTDLKTKSYDVNKDNYYKNGILYFNVYKTAKTYGTQTLEVKTLAPDFDKMIKKWIKLNDNEYMLFGTNGNKLTSPQVTKKLNQIFNGRNISTDILRHVFLTHKYGSIQKAMKNDASMMGNSLEEQALYIKH